MQRILSVPDLDEFYQVQNSFVIAGAEPVDGSPQL